MESPTRARFGKEKGDLQSLNSRFETYIVKQRHRDTSTNRQRKELDEQRRKAEEELDNYRRWHSEQVELLRAQREETEKTLAGKCLEVDAANGTIETLQSELENEKSFSKRMLEKIRSLTESNSDLSNNLFNIKAELAESQTDLEAELKHSHDLEEELKAAHEANSTLRESLAREHGQRMVAEDELAQERLKNRDHKSVRATLGTTVKELQARLNEEDPYHKRVAQRELSKLQGKCDTLLKDNIEHLEQLNEEKLAGYQDEIEKIGHNLGLSNHKLDLKERAHDDAVGRNDELARINADLLAKIETLEKKLRDARLEPARIKADAKRTILGLKDEFKRKDKLFNDLMDVKVPFDLELKHLGDLLANEETRLHLNHELIYEPEVVASPRHKKPKRTRKKSATKVQLRSSKRPKRKVVKKTKAKAMEVEEVEAITLESQEDENGHFITLTNKTTGAVSTMQKWSLLFGASRSTFEFPDVAFEPNDTFIVRMTDSDVILLPGSGKVPVGTWNPDQDHVYLNNPDGTLVAEFDIE